MVAIDRLGQENIVESQKFCYRGNVTSHFSSYYHAIWLLDLSNYLFLTISNTESAIGVTERGKISMHGNKNTQVD